MKGCFIIIGIAVVAFVIFAILELIIGLEGILMSVQMFTVVFFVIKWISPKLFHEMFN